MANRHPAARRLALLMALLLALGGHAAAEAPRYVLHGPLIPPDGQAYDDWKGLSYTRDTAFDVELDWYLRSPREEGPLSEAVLREKNYVLDPARPHARFEITSVRAEPVGGEMRLRSGGYVDITLEAAMTSDQFRYAFDTSREDGEGGILFGLMAGEASGGFRFSTADLYPFDRYTGVSLLNFIDDGEDKGTNQGEATDSGFVESQVSWAGRTWRLLARRDHRNASTGSFSYRVESGRCYADAPVATEFTYTFRVPADYDGLALACPRSITCSPPDPDAGKDDAPQEIYADILTGGSGATLDPADYWFIRVSDLVERFRDAPAPTAGNAEN